MNTTFQHIDTLEDAEFEIIDSGLQDGFLSRFMDRNKGVLSNALASVINHYAADKKGQLFTTGLAASGYAKDPIALKAFYENNAPAIDGYFAHVDLHALADAIGGNVEEELITTAEKFLRYYGPAFITGAGVIAAVIYLKRRRA